MELTTIQSKIYEIRGIRVMLDFDLAQMYGVETRVLNQAVKRNILRFPHDFMFPLTSEEWEMMSSQFVMTYPNKRPKSSPPLAFSEHGVAMLASVLRSERAITVNIQIIRAFIALRQYALGFAELNQKLEQFMVETDVQLGETYEALTELASQKELENKPRNPIGFNHIGEDGEIENND